MDLTFVAANLLLVFVAWLLGHNVLPAVSRVERGVITVIGVPVVIIPTLTLLGALHQLTLRAALAALVLEAVALVGWAAWARGRSPRPIAGSEQPAKPRTTLPELAIGGALFGMVFTVASRTGAILLANPRRLTADDLAYHAPMAAAWLTHESLILAPANYHAYYPGNAELFATWLMLPARLDTYAALAGVFWLALAASAMALLCVRQGAHWTAPLVGVAVMLGCRPFIQDALTFAAVDLAGTVLTAAATAVAVGVTASISPRELAARMLYVGSCVGLAAGSKVTFAPVGVLLVLWMLWVAKPSPRRAALGMGLSAITAVLSGGYWYLRNLLITGNPIFPAALLGFEGPLDAAARKPTSLLYQLQHLKPEAIDGAISELLRWPPWIAYVCLGAFGGSLLALLRPRAWRDETWKRIALCMLAGLLVFAVIASGPFSGTHNDKWGGLKVRLRFLLPLALFGITLAATHLGRLRAASPWVALVAGAAAMRWLGVAWVSWIPAAAFGAALGAAVHYGVSERQRVAFVWAVAVLACVGATAAASSAIGELAPRDQRVRRRIEPAWDALDKTPHGSRVAWFAASRTRPYVAYVGFKRVPIAVDAGGSPAVFMHENWRELRPTWWKQKKRRVSLDRVVDNLLEQNVDYVLVMRKKKKANWPSQEAILRASDHATLTVEKPTFELFELSQKAHKPKPKAKRAK